MLVYSLIAGKYKVSLIFVMLFIINYTALSASGNIFLSDTYSGTKKIKLSFDESLNINGDFHSSEIITGSLFLADKVIAPYIKIKNDTPLTIIKINLKDVSLNLRKKILKKLKAFIIKQDNPVILYGDFGEPSWKRYLRRFIVQTRLSVKNRLLFTHNKPYNIFSTPSFYILGFNDMGIDNIVIKNNGKTNVINFDVLY